jgi:ABC-type Fe3+-hydroxamate transport system, periplasmic component
MVPSMTETLLRAGVQVVGRTRYCIHPPKMITNVPIVGGTKDVSWDLVMDLKPDLVLLDKEENPLEMAEECPLPFIATHVTSLKSLHEDLVMLAERFENPQLMEWAVDAYDIYNSPAREFNFQKVPGFQEWVKMPSRKYEKVNYLIWKKPWMAVTRETFIGSVLEKLGANILEFPEGEKYPVIELEDMQNTFNLFSSEPYPFAKKIPDLREDNLEGCIVNGESYSWFGIRTIEFLKGAR